MAAFVGGGGVQRRTCGEVEGASLESEAVSGGSVCCGGGGVVGAGGVGV